MFFVPSDTGGISEGVVLKTGKIDLNEVNMHSEELNPCKCCGLCKHYICLHAFLGAIPCCITWSDFTLRIACPAKMRGINWREFPFYKRLQSETSLSILSCHTLSRVALSEVIAPSQSFFCLVFPPQRWTGKMPKKRSAQVVCQVMAHPCSHHIAICTNMSRHKNTFSFMEIVNKRKRWA